MRTITTLVAVLALTLSTADAGPRKAHAPRDSVWMRECITEHTGPLGGVSATEARRICKAEQPEDEVTALKAQLTLAKLNAKVTKAKTRVRRAIEDCAQAITDRCVETADPVHGTDCNVDPGQGLHAEYLAVCLGQEGK